MKPAAWNLGKPATLWLDISTGIGVDDNGAPVKPIIGGRRKNPSLEDLLNTTAQRGATRLMLSGSFPAVSASKPHWLLVPTGEWQGGGHYIRDDRPPTGRFWRPRPDGSTQKVEVRVAREWFGTDAISPSSAREAMELTHGVLAGKALPGELGVSPSATGQNVWAYSLPKDLDPVQVSPEIAELIHNTSGQHRTEHLVGGRSRCDCGNCVPLIEAGAEIDGFCYVDGRFMYSALCREIGVGGRMLTRQEAEQWATDQHARARYRVRFTVPDLWDTLGVLGVYREDIGRWHWPNRPGATYETWVDAVELFTARSYFWNVEIVEGIGFEKARPLDNFAARLLKARERAGALDADAHLIEAVESALRAILLQTIGAFHSLGRDRTMTVTSTLEVPAEYQASIRQFGDVITYMIPADVTNRMLAFHHPEYSAQVWARERARILSAPIARYSDPASGEWTRWGALDVRPDQLIGINGDAIYLTQIPRAALPAEQGGGDDGKVGRLRVKGHIPGPMPAPPTTEARNTLRGKAEALGVPDNARAGVESGRGEGAE